MCWTAAVWPDGTDECGPAGSRRASLRGLLSPWYGGLIMARRLVVSLALAVTALMAAALAHAISEADRLWLVGERAFQDGLVWPLRRA